MSERIRRMKSKQVEQILRRNGFQLISQEGTHRKWRHLERRQQVIVPQHAGRDLPIGTLRQIFVHAGIPEQQWKD